MKLVHECCPFFPPSFVQLVTRTKKIFVGGLSVNTTIEDVKQYFDQFGKVSGGSTRFGMKPASPYGLAYVCRCRNKSAAQKSRSTTSHKLGRFRFTAHSRRKTSLWIKQLDWEWRSYWGGGREKKARRGQKKITRLGGSGSSRRSLGGLEDGARGGGGVEEEVVWGRGRKVL